MLPFVKREYSKMFFVPNLQAPMSRLNLILAKIPVHWIGWELRKLLLQALDPLRSNEDIWCKILADHLPPLSKNQNEII